MELIKLWIKILSLFALGIIYISIWKWFSANIYTYSISKESGFAENLLGCLQWLWVIIHILVLIALVVWAWLS